MLSGRKVIIAGALMVAGVVVPASAHHSTAEFDYTKEKKVEGTIKEFQWTNPHSWVYVWVPQGGKRVLYGFELGAPNVNVRMGWRRDSLKVNDKVTITYAPVRTDEPKGTLKTITLPNGKVLYGVAYNFAKALQGEHK